MKKSIVVITALLIASVLTATALCFSVLLAPRAVFSLSASSIRIVLDAGHGGIDRGVCGKTTGVKESEINLAVTSILGEILSDSGFEVTLTRKTEAGLYDTTAKGFKKRDMQRRKEIIERADPAFVISVHQNFYPTSATRGAQVFYKKSSVKGKKFAVALQGELNKLYATQGVKQRTVMTGDYFMLRCTENPSVIVECGFLSNAEDERLLSQSAWQRSLAEAIAAGIKNYLYDYTA